jgi:hypothetical protein
VHPYVEYRGTISDTSEEDGDTFRGTLVHAKWALSTPNVTGVARATGAANIPHPRRLHPRDIRLLDPSTAEGSESCIIVRDSIILINIPPIRVVILNDRCLFIQPNYDNNTDVNIVFKKISGHRCADAHSMPFEFRATEASLSAVVTILNHELVELSPKVLDVSLELDAQAGGKINARMLQAVKEAYYTRDFSLQEKLKHLKNHVGNCLKSRSD